MTVKIPKIIIFLGLPGSGKGTQGMLLSSSLGVAHLSIGSVLREEILAATALGKKVQNAVEKGILVSDNIIHQSIKQMFDCGKMDNGCILDGFPRTISQAEFFSDILHTYNKKLHAVVYLEIDEETAQNRIFSRHYCPNCNRDYSISPDTIKSNPCCDDCKVELLQRSDTDKETLYKRFSEFNNKTAPLLEYYEKRNLLNRFFGTTSKAELHTAIMQRLELYNS